MGKSILCICVDCMITLFYYWRKANCNFVSFKIQEYDPDLPPELAAATGMLDAPAENAKSDVGRNDLTKGPTRIRPPLVCLYHLALYLQSKIQFFFFGMSKCCLVDHLI